MDGRERKDVIPGLTFDIVLKYDQRTHMMRKGQIKRLDGRDAEGQSKFVASLFGVAA